MLPSNPPGPRWPFNVAMAGLLLIGGICLMPAIFALGDGEWIALMIALLVMALHFALAVFIYQRKLWAVIIALSLYSLALLGYLVLLAVVIFVVFESRRAADEFDAVAIIGCVDIALGFLVFCLFKSLRIIWRSRRQEARGFQVLQAVLPVEEISEPEDDPFDHIQ